MIGAIKVTCFVIFILSSFFYFGYCAGEAAAIEKYSDQISEIFKKLGIKEAEDGKD